ncbi:MAG: TolC family protein [Thermoanaerobaculia bacterium]
MNKTRIPSTLLAFLAATAPAHRAWPQGPPAPTARSLTLRETLERALALSPGLDAAQAAGSAANAEASLARDAFHPEAWASSTPGYSSGIPVAVAGRVPAIAGVEVRQTLYDRQSRSQIFQTEALAAAKEGEAGRTRNETARAAALLYARCWFDGPRVDSARRRQLSAETIRDHVAARVREGRRTELDLERAQLEAAKARQKTLDAESDRDLDFRELRITIGAEPNLPIAIAEDPQTALGSGPGTADLARLRAADPALRSLELELAALRRSERVEGSALSPVVAVEGQYSRLSRANGYDRYYRSFKADDWSVGLSVAVPLWSGNRVEDSRARLESRIAAAEAQRRGRLTALDLAAGRAEAGLDRASAAESLAERGVGVSTEALWESESLRREGREEPDEVEKRQIELSDSEEEALRARLDWISSRCDLLSLSGELAASAR